MPDQYNIEHSDVINGDDQNGEDGESDSKLV